MYTLKSIVMSVLIGLFLTVGISFLVREIEHSAQFSKQEAQRLSASQADTALFYQYMRDHQPYKAYNHLKKAADTDQTAIHSFLYGIYSHRCLHNPALSEQYFNRALKAHHRFHDPMPMLNAWLTVTGSPPMNMEAEIQKAQQQSSESYRLTNCPQ